MNTILSVNNYYYRRGGAESVFLGQNELLERAGWTIVPFAMQHPRNLETSWARYFVDCIEFGEHYPALQKLAISAKVIYSFEAIRQIRQLIDKVKPGLCHAHNIYHHISPSILDELRRQSIPVVLTLHDLKLACPAYKMLSNGRVCEDCRPHKIYNVLMKRCLKDSVAVSGLAMLESLVHRVFGLYIRGVDRFVVPSRFFIEKLVEWGWDRDKFAYVPNFVDTSTLRPEFNPGRRALFFGRLSEEKGLGTLIDACNRTGISLDIVGDGPERPRLEARAAQAGDHIRFLGYQSGEALYKLIRHSRVVVIPSEWYENAPMSVLEAYALGKTVIGARIGGIPELIRVGETGALFEPGSVEELSARLADWQTMPDNHLVDLGRRARQVVESEYSANLYVDRLSAVYRELGVSLG